MNRFYNEKNKNQTFHGTIRVLLVIAVLLLCFIGQMQAQCYDKSRSNGVAEMKSKHYDKAIQWFQQAKDCDDKPANNDLDTKIKECENLKAEAIKAKKDAEEKRKQEEEEARIREEQKRIQREYEEEQERQMARSAYMQITNVSFLNVDDEGNVIPQSGILYKQDIKYMLPVIHYNGLADDNRHTTIYCKIFKPGKGLMQWDDSPSDYSYSYPMTIEPGYGNVQSLTSWGSKDGNTFNVGEYTFEIYNEYGGLIDSRQFTVFDKPPTTVNVTFNVDDRNAEIYVDGRPSGMGTTSMSLEIGKTYKVETRKASHTSPYRNITAQKDMQKTITLDSPQPIYGSLSVSASKNDVSVYLNGSYKGTAPQNFNELLIGEYNVKLSKDKYYDYTSKVTIKANQQSSVFAEMQRIKHTPWIFRKPDRFASVFVNPVYVFDHGLNFEDLGSVGGHFTYCRTHLGFFAQYAHGIETKNQSYSAGVVFRLTNRSVDLQLLGGVASNKMVETFYDCSYYGSYTYTQNAWMGNAGIRIGWSSGSFSWWDLMGGVMFDGNRTIPYVGLGLGTTLTAGIIGAGIYGLQYLKK